MCETPLSGDERDTVLACMQTILQQRGLDALPLPIAAVLEDRLRVIIAKLKCGVVTMETHGQRLVAIDDGYNYEIHDWGIYNRVVKTRTVQTNGWYWRWWDYPKGPAAHTSIVNWLALGGDEPAGWIKAWDGREAQ